MRSRGYPDDSEVIRMMHDAEYRGDTVLGALLHYHPTQTAVAKAMRERGGLVADLLAARRAGTNRELRSLVDPSDRRAYRAAQRA